MYPLFFKDVPENYAKLFKDLIKSQDVEKEIGNEAALTEEVEEIIKSCNAEPNFHEKIRILSLIANRYSYSYLAKFNRPEDRKRCADQEENFNPDLEEGGNETSQNLPTIFWEKKLNRHAYQKAKKLYLSSEHGFGKIIKKVRRVTRVEPAIVDAVFSYVISNEGPFTTYVYKILPFLTPPPFD